MRNIYNDTYTIRGRVRIKINKLQKKLELLKIYNKEIKFKKVSHYNYKRNRFDKQLKKINNILQSINLLWINKKFMVKLKGD